LVALILCSGSNAFALQPSDRANAGFIYGEIETRSGRTYRGFLRWGNQEAFWDDLFHSSKQDNPYLEKDWWRDFERSRDRDRDRDDRRRRRRGFRWGDWDVRWGDNGGSSRIFVARFGDIEQIVVTGDKRADIVMKSGSTYDVEGYSDDVGGKIHVDDQEFGKIELRWGRIETIRFMAAPRDADPGVTRLHGTLQTDSGEFQGFVQWDKQECTSDDVLDGETDDGEVDIPMGRIRSIERRSRRSSIIELKDGREFEMRGSNDVNNDNRGIMVEDPRYGRVTIPWSDFDKVTFSDDVGSGRGYAEFAGTEPIFGTVTDADGEGHSGRLVVDLDETEGWEMLNGRMRDIPFDIPFELIASIEPLGGDACKITLRTGEELELEDGQDVSDRNAGVLIFKSDDGDPVYVRWRDVERIEFSR
jgi:hypothetical protein